MNILFVYSFTNLYTTLSKYSGEHKCAFVTFRQEYAKEKVSPLYVFDVTSSESSRHNPLLTKSEIEESFKYSAAMKFINRRIHSIGELGRKYEQFYLNIFEREKTECLVMHGNGYGFQQVGYRLAKILELKIAITENGYFRPLTLTVENDGVNAFSVMKQWHFGWATSESEQQSFDEFMRFRGDYRDSGAHRGSALGRVSKELKQRFVYKDCEGYDHNWITRIRKYAWNQKHLKNGTEPLPLGEYICFFVSSIYDPQLSIPSYQHINKIVIQVLRAFETFSTYYPQVNLVIKEHPLDQTRVLLDYHSMLSLYKNVTVTNANANLLIRNAKGIITINSSVGITALIEKTPLLCLGDALYSHRGLCLQIEEELTEERILRALHQLMEFKPNVGMINSFLNSLFIKTQIAAERDRDVQEAISQKFFNRLTSNVQ